MSTIKGKVHYHNVGLLEEPQRGSNGYKRYGVAHLVRLLRIKRLADLGVPLAQIAAMGDLDEHPEAKLRALDAQLAANLDRLRRVRAELALLMRQRAPIDLPPELAPVTARLSEADRSLVVVLTRVLGPTALDVWQKAMLDHPRDPVIDQFDKLPADADEQTRQDLAERLLPHAQALTARHAGLWDVGPHASRDAKSAARVVGQAINDLYTHAQIDVLQRLHHLTQGQRNRGAPDRSDRPVGRTHGSSPRPALKRNGVHSPCPAQAPPGKRSASPADR